jgi:hypothetical protein
MVVRFRLTPGFRVKPASPCLRARYMAKASSIMLDIEAPFKASMWIALHKSSLTMTLSLLLTNKPP